MTIVYLYANGEIVVSGAAQVPAIGSTVTIDGSRRWSVRAVEWDIYTKDTSSTWPGRQLRSGYPQQSATIHLERLS